MAHTKPDRRVARTRGSLHQAHMALIREKGYEATTIQEIVSRANVGRSTFYAHYGSKETLALSGLDHLRDILLPQQRTASNTQGRGSDQRLAFSRAFFEHLNEYRDLFQSLLGNSAEPATLKKLKRILADLVGQDLAPLKHGSNAIPRGAVIRFTVDAFLSVLFWWLNESPRSSPAKVDEIFRRMILPTLTAISAE